MVTATPVKQNSPVVCRDPERVKVIHGILASLRKTSIDTTRLQRDYEAELRMIQ
jgi:hypothetical protein